MLPCALQMARMKVHSIKRSLSAMAALQSSELQQLQEQHGFAEQEWPAAASFQARAGGQQSRAFGAAAAAAIAAAAAALHTREEGEELGGLMQQGGSRGGGSQSGRGSQGAGSSGAGGSHGGAAVSEEALGSDEFFELPVGGGGTSSW
jgi:hypothetical protein